MNGFASFVVVAALFRLALSDFLPPCHVVAGGKTVRPGQLYVVSAYLCTEGKMKLTTSIAKSGVVVTTAKLDIAFGSHVQIPLKVPTRITNGDYKLIVEGALEGTNKYFYNSTSLIYSPKLAAIVIQTSRPIYRASQTVYFRVLALQTDLKAYDDALDVYVIDSDGFVMRRWLSMFTNNGILSMKYKLPEYVKEGSWKIRVKTFGQVEEQRIQVENYFDPYFEVFVEMPPYASAINGVLKAKIQSMMTTQEIVNGNMTLTLSIKTDEEPNRLLWERKMFINNGSLEMTLDMSSVGANEGDLKLTAQMTDLLYGSTSSGFAVTRLITDVLKIRFMCDGPIPFRLSKSFTVILVAESSSGHSVSPDTLENSKVAIEVEETQQDGSVNRKGPIEVFPINLIDELDNVFLADPDALQEFSNSGVLAITVKPSAKISSVTLKAIMTVGESTYEAKAFAIDVSSQFGNIALSTSTFTPEIGEYAVFHLTTDVAISSFQYLVVSKDNIVNGGEIEMEAGKTATTASFSVAMGPDMAPGFRLIAYAVFNNTLMVDSVFLPMAAFNRYEMELTMNNAKDPKGDNVEIIVSGDEGAYIAINSARERYSYKMQAGNDMSLSRVVNSLMDFEDDLIRIPKMKRRSLDGEEPEHANYYPAPNYGRTPRQTFALNGLVVISNMISKQGEGSCESPQMHYCNVGGCYSTTQKCNGISDCPDSTDEQNCEIVFEEDYDFIVSRMSRSAFLFDAEDGDWAWREVKKNDHEGIEFDPVDVPQVAEEWILNAFSVSPRLGFSILDSPVRYSSKRGLMAHLRGPKSCRRGEQLGLRLVIQNHDPTRSLILIRVLGSTSYRFIKVGGEGIVSSYAPKTVEGDQHILIYIPGNSQERLDLPVVPAVEKGSVEVRVIASSQAGRADMIHVIEVLPEGAEVRRHTSSVLDLRNRAFAMTYLDIPIEESPIVPYQEWRRYVFGSPSCSISITANLLGPLLAPDDVSLESTLERHSKGTDVRLYEFGVSIWTLHYRRVLTILEGPVEVRERLEHANFLYANIMKRFNEAGYFANWDLAPPSVWLTAWVVRVMRQAIYADWEYILYIDRTVIERCLNWIVTYQTPEGKFVETSNYFRTPLDRRVADTRASKVTLTAHVIIALSECLDLVEGSTRNLVFGAIRNGLLYLESKINLELESYSLAVSTWAMQLGKSQKLQTAFQLLMRNMRLNADGLPYWSSVNIPPPPTKKENQRPFRRPRLYGEDDSKAVETTSYALMIIMSQDGVTTLTENVVLWLQAMRMTKDGFVSMTDTLLAMQALTDYANRARLVDVMKMDVRVTSSVDPTVDHFLHIENRSYLSTTEVIEMNRVWGHINILGRGSGLALIQLQMSYGVDEKSLLDVPFAKNFDLTIRQFYSAYRNKSSIIIEACTRWLKTEPENSGSAVLEIDTPTGYFLVESDAEAVAKAQSHPGLRSAKTLHHKTIWLFDRIPNEKHCFNHSVRRWYPVANMTLHRSAILYEANARESFTQILLNSTPLYTLSICEVCGSYQCPYCPYYNVAVGQRMKGMMILFIPPVILLMTCKMT